MTSRLKIHPTIAAGLLMVSLIFFCQPAVASFKNTRFEIFSGDRGATFFAVASGVCNVFNRHYVSRGFECKAVASEGSASNLRKLVEKKADLAIIKSPRFNQFFVADFSSLKDGYEFVAPIHNEYLTILVRKNSGIKSLSDLNDRSVNIGNIGSSSALIVSDYFAKFSINPTKILRFGAAEAFKKICEKKIDAWVYFVGHPNVGFGDVLKRCAVELVQLSPQEVKNFLDLGGSFLAETKISKRYYQPLSDDLATVSSETILAARSDLNPKIIELIKDVLSNHKEELIAENNIFRSF